MDSFQFAVICQEVVDPVALAALDDLHGHFEPLAGVNVHHFAAALK